MLINDQGMVQWGERSRVKRFGVRMKKNIFEEQKNIFEELSLMQVY